MQLVVKCKYIDKMLGILLYTSSVFSSLRDSDCVCVAVCVSVCGFLYLTDLFVSVCSSRCLLVCVCVRLFRDFHERWIMRAYAQRVAFWIREESFGQSLSFRSAAGWRWLKFIESKTVKLVNSETRNQLKYDGKVRFLHTPASNCCSQWCTKRPQSTEISGPWCWIAKKCKY